VLIEYKACCSYDVDEGGGLLGGNAGGLILSGGVFVTGAGGDPTFSAGNASVELLDGGAKGSMEARLLLSFVTIDWRAAEAEGAFLSVSGSDFICKTCVAFERGGKGGGIGREGGVWESPWGVQDEGASTGAAS